jgi:protoporphyrinogen oxidase
VRIGILGGGLVGLVVASRCRHHECEVLEFDNAVGGHCRSLVEGGYTFDIGGPHIMFSRNQEILALMYEQLGDNLAQRRRSRVDPQMDRDSCAGSRAPLPQDCRLSSTAQTSRRAART